MSRSFSTFMNHYALAVDLGATNVRVALVSRDGKIGPKLKEKTPKHGRNGTVISQKIIEMIGRVLADYPGVRPMGIGISSMGPLDYKRGGPLASPNIPFEFVPLVEPLRLCLQNKNNDKEAEMAGIRLLGTGLFHAKTLA